jgi:hypothetical protein
MADESHLSSLKQGATLGMNGDMNIGGIKRT